MKSEKNIIDKVLFEEHFTDNEKLKFKQMLQIISENKKFGFHKDLRKEILSVIERDDKNEN